MALVTITSDFGLQDHYVAAVKARMLQVNPQLNIVDISHQIEKYNLAHAAFVLQQVYADFPKGTVHIVAMSGTSRDNQGFVAVKHREHLFLGPNNGVLSLLFEEEPGIKVQLAETPGAGRTFPTLDILAPVAAKIASGAAVHDFGGPLAQWKRLIPRQFKANKKQISGHVIYIDSYGNLITNIPQHVFETLNPGRFSLEIGRETFHRLHSSYEETDSGECFAFFNRSGLLEIGITHGSGTELLGLKLDSPVRIHFDSE